jgi:ketol-acid reductoisomerase
MMNSSRRAKQKVKSAGSIKEAFYDSDASLEVLPHQTLGIIGYGNHGRAQVLNFRAGQTLDFAQWYNIRFGLIAPSA